MTDPYQVLGISKNATDDEIKRAYRELSRKYHPDSYIDNPLAELAEEKFKEVQVAYDQIMNDKANGYSSYGSSNSYYENSSSNANSREMADVASLINARRYREALTSLQSLSDRSSRWYYYTAVANAGLGNNFEALNNCRQACSMEPGNQEYSNFLNQLQWGSNQYRQRGQSFGRTSDAGDLCCNLLIADTCCECMGGDLCACI